MPCFVSAINCNGNHRGVKNCSASRVAKLTISTGRRVAGMLYSMLQYYVKGTLIKILFKPSVFVNV